MARHGVGLPTWTGTGKGWQGGVGREVKGR